MTEIALAAALLIALAVGLGLALGPLRARREAAAKVEAAQENDERRLAATHDPVRRARLKRRMANRLKE